MDFELGWPHISGGYDGAVTYQTGVATSWPSYKSLVRSTEAVVRTAEVTFALSVVLALGAANATAAADLAALQLARQALALVTHHDSLPGTMRTAVSSNASSCIGP